MEQKFGKKHYRCHAHTNSFRDQNVEIPAGPDAVRWDEHFENGAPPECVDIGCGYGRFLMKVARSCPGTNILGMEIRDKVAEYVRLNTGDIPNCSVVKTNALLFLPNFVHAGSLRRIFVLFPDPHFKKRKQKGRVICRQMLAVYQYLLARDGELWISTDVEGLFADMCGVIEESGMFEWARELEEGPAFEMSYRDTDEAHRAGVKSGHTFGRIYRVVK